MDARVDKNTADIELSDQAVDLWTYGRVKDGDSTGTDQRPDLAGRVGDTKRPAVVARGD